MEQRKKEQALVREPCKTKIGGQALIEGIMMKGPQKSAMAVRKKDGTIDLEVWDEKPKKWYNKAPFIRGVFNFVSQMIDGYRLMMKSAERSGMLDDDESEELSKFEIWLNEKIGDKLTGVIMAIAMVIGIAFALVLFMFVPTWLFTGLNTLIPADITAFRSLFEGILKILIFVIYLALTAKSKDVRRTYEFHGAEHKTIATFEAGEELKVENVRKHTRFHPRCGTSFIFLTLAISILLYSIFPINSELFIGAFGVTKATADIIRVGFKLLLLPLIVGVSYEVLRLAGKYNDNALMKIVSAPGLYMQRLTTKEPDDDQIKCAIAAMNAVIPENE